MSLYLKPDSWLWNLLEELGYPEEYPTLIKGDNDGSISMAKNPQFHNQSKHIAIQWHWIRELIRHDLIEIENCWDPEQTANVLTSAWKSGPVRSFVQIWQDWDQDQSSQVEEPQKTGLNRRQPVQCGFGRFFTVERPVSTSLSLNWLRTGWGLVL